VRAWARPAALAAIAGLLTLPVVASAVVEHGPWDRLLATYVDPEGRVAYRDLVARDQATFDAYLATLAAATVGDAADKDAHAFWINAYNAGIVAAVLQGYTAENTWRRRSIFRTFTFEVAGARRTLDQIEHEIVRPRFHDPRTHFALVCASSSCPKLRRGAYTGANLEAALEEETRRFLRDPVRNVIDPATSRLELSAIFDWFEDDFTTAAGSVRAFVARYLADPARRTFVVETRTPVGHLPYDWTLNAQAGQRP
jgi:hypothetical protein